MFFPHLYSYYSYWLAAFSFDLEVFLLLLTSFTVCHTSHVYKVSYFIDLTLNVFYCPFWYGLVNSLCALSLCTLTFVVFLLLLRDAIFTLSHFFLTASVSHGTLFGSWFGWYALCCCCFYVDIDKVFVFFIWSMRFRYLLKSIEFVSYNYRIFITNISVGKWGPVLWFWLFILFQHRLRHIFAR